MIRIIAVCDSYSHFKQPIEEYIKRMRDVKMEFIKPEKWDTKTILEKESNKIKEFLKKRKWYNVYLDIVGTILSTQELYNLVEKKQQDYGEINFIIWWAYGIKNEILDNVINERISLSKMTFPHSMALLIILEQIYRVISIKNWSSYHHW